MSKKKFNIFVAFALFRILRQLSNNDKPKKDDRVKRLETIGGCIWTFVGILIIALIGMIIGV